MQCFSQTTFNEAQALNTKIKIETIEDPLFQQETCWVVGSSTVKY